MTTPLERFRSQVQFTPQTDAVGNLHVGHGRVGDVSPYVAIVENRMASGALGAAECRRLASLYEVAAQTRTPLALYVDSAGARLSEGLLALGAFRRLYRAALETDEAGVEMIAVLGTHCFGGASMLVALCGRRYYNPATQLAMSGPSILATAAGGSALDEMFRAIVTAAIGAEARTRLPDNEWHGETLAFAASVDARARHRLLGERLPPLRPVAPETLLRKDLQHLYPDGYRIDSTDGLIVGEAAYDGKTVAVLGSIDRRTLTALRAWRLADAALRMVETPPDVLHVLIDCEGHSTQLDDEKPMLSSYLADLAAALHMLARSGCTITVIVLGTLGGGAYVALAGAAHEVHMLHGAHIQLLPGKAIAAILGSEAESGAAIADYVSAGVAERELKVGYLRDR